MKQVKESRERHYCCAAKSRYFNVPPPYQYPARESRWHALNMIHMNDGVAASPNLVDIWRHPPARSGVSHRQLSSSAAGE